MWDYCYMCPVFGLRLNCNWQHLYLTDTRPRRPALPPVPYERPNGPQHGYVCPSQGMEFDLMQKSRSARKATKKTTTARGTKSSNGQNAPVVQRRTLVSEGSPEFETRCEEAMNKVRQKYAWTAQQEGFVLRRNPLRQPPLKDYVYIRIAKAEYGFRYQDAGGRKKFWYPELAKVFSQYYEPEYHENGYDGTFVIAERIEFMPGP
jgi:hypothetical protein